MQYPMNMELAGRRCMVLGGGPVALRKAGTLLEAGAALRLMAPKILPELEELAEEGKLQWIRQPYEEGCLEGCFLLICATDDPMVNRRAAEEAKRLGILVNAPAQPEISDFSVPASLRRGNLLLTVSTGNLSPALSRLLRQQLEKEFPPAFGPWLERLHILRQEVKEKLSTSREREAFWREALDGRILEFVKAGQIGQAEVELRHAIDGNRVKP